MPLAPPRARRRAGALALFALATALAAAAAARASVSPSHPAKAYEVRNGLWFDGERFGSRTMYVVNERFTADRPARVDSVIDLRGGYVLPPFADAHHHALADSASFAEESAAMLARGIFYLKNPNDPGRRARAARPLAGTPRTVDAVYAHGGLTSSGGHPAQLYASFVQRGMPGWTEADLDGETYFAVDDAADLARTWPAVLAGRPDFVKVYLEESEHHAERRGADAFVGRRGLDPALLPEVVARARAAGLTVSAHVTSRADFAAAVGAGVDEITHLPMEALAAEDARMAAARGVWVVTTATSHKPAPDPRTLAAIHAGNLALLRDAGVRLALGTDNHHTVVEEAEAVCRLGVLDNAALLRVWTVQTPRAIFPGRAVGAFDEGSEASFIVLAADPLADFGAVRQVGVRMKRGHVLAPAGPPPAAAHGTPDPAPARCRP